MIGRLAVLGGMVLALLLGVLGMARLKPATSQWLMYETYWDYRWSLARMKMNGDHPRPLVTSPEYQRFIGASPDGKWLLVETGGGLNTPLRLHRVRRQGGALERLPLPSYRQFIAWSPRGGGFLFFGSDGLYQSAWDGTGVQVLHLHEGRPDAYVSAPFWSPDGDSVYFGRAERTGRGFALYQVRAGQAPVRVASLEGSESFWGWSPDGRALVHTRGYGASSDLYLLPLAGGEAVRLTFRGGLEVFKAWSPDGEYIIYNHALPPSNISDIFRIHVATGEIERLTENRKNNYFVAWSPDASALVYESGAGIDGALFMLDAEAQRTRQLTFSGGNDYFESWSPDGEWVIYWSAGGTHWELYRARLRDGHTEQISRGIGDKRFVAWLPVADLPLRGGLLWLGVGLLWGGWLWGWRRKKRLSFKPVDLKGAARWLIQPPRASF